MSVKPVMRAVVRIRQSPLNEKVWNVELECGHDMWITRSKRPTMTKLACDNCTYPRVSQDAARDELP